MSSDFIFNFAKEFTRFPGGRLRMHGPKSGEEFRDDVLLPLLAEHDRLTIDLKAALGFGASFLDEAFGELAKHYSESDIRLRMEIVAEDDPTLVPMIWERISLVASEQH